MDRTVTSLSRSHAYCERLARREAGNFYHAFRILPGPQRRAMCALYAFLRVSDDLADGPGTPERKAGMLQAWRSQFQAALAGHYQHPVHAAIHQAIRVHRIPPEHILAVLDGVEMDLTISRYETFADLYTYCYRVASAVGLACIHVWGFTDEQAKVHAESAGIAFQLTNILRDLGEDASRGRIYLPREDLRRFQCPEESIQRQVCDDRVRTLLQFEVERARGYYKAAWPLAPLLPAPGRAVFQVMMQTYHQLLTAIEERGFDVFQSRVTVSRWRKWSFAVRALPIRFGFRDVFPG